MKIKDKLLIKTGDETVMKLVYITSIQTQHFFSKPEDIVHPPNEAILWVGDIGVTSFIPIKKKHNFIQLNDDTWELDVEPIEMNDL